jgi:hypothetical protein
MIAPMQAAGDYLTTAQARVYLGGVCRNTLYRWAREAGMVRFKRGNVVRWPRWELDRVIKQSTKAVR